MLFLRCAGDSLLIDETDHLLVWSIDIVSSYPVPDGYGDREATAMGSAG